MKLRRPIQAALAIVLVSGALAGEAGPSAKGENAMDNVVPGTVIELPKPVLKSEKSLEETLAKRQSVRSYTAKQLSIQEVSQLLWAGQGEKGRRFGRTAPSAGALYPLELYLVTRQGTFHYDSRSHSLVAVHAGDLRDPLAAAALGQGCVRTAPAVIVVSAVVDRTAVKYRGRAERYVHMEVGHAAQNILLEAVSLGLGAVPVGAFEDARVRQVLKLPENQSPLMLIPVGQPAEGR